MKRNVLETSFFVLMILIGVILLFFIFKPYLGALFLALVFTVIFSPVHKLILKRLHGWKTTSALFSVIILLLSLLLPLFIIGALLFQEARDMIVTLQNGGGVSTFLDTRLVGFEKYINTIAPETNFRIDLQEYVRAGASWITENLGAFFSGIANGVVNIFVMVLALFFLLRDGDRIKEVLMKWSPLGDGHDKYILDRMAVAVNSTIKGSLFIAVIQGFLAGIGFVVFGVPSPVLWGFVTTVAALVPNVGTALVVVPASIYLYVSGAPAWAFIGLLSWGIGAVGTIDNLLRPIIIQRGVNIHPFLILLSVLGGISFFGPIGFLAGPIVLSFVFTLIEVMPNVFHRAE